MNRKAKDVFAEFPSVEVLYSDEHTGDIFFSEFRESLVAITRKDVETKKTIKKSKEDE